MRSASVLALVLVACAAPVRAATSKVVVIGFDGADARLVEQWMDEGQLPELDRLRREGSFAPLEPTNPPQTPVSWASFATGTDPGRTRIFDFLKRDPDDYLPDFAMMSESRRSFGFGERNGLVGGVAVGVVVLGPALLALRLLGAGRTTRRLVSLGGATAAGILAGFAAAAYLPVEVPDAVNNRQGKTFWEIADEAGLRARIVRVPATFPAEPMEHGHMLSGLGVPDVRGRVGTPSYYTSDARFSPGDNEFSLELIRLAGRRGTLSTRIVGPFNKPFYDYVVEREASAGAPADRQRLRREARRRLDEAGVARRLDLPLRLEVTDSKCTVTVGEHSATLGVGEWSDWFELDFPINPVVDWLGPLRGIARFKLLELEPELKLYLSPINFHPDCHPVAFAWPPEESERLRRRFGLYKTIGWASDTWSLPSGVGDETLFLEDMEFTVDKYSEIMRGLLSDGDFDLYVQVFYFTDRVGHLFWHHLDPGHPLYDVARAARWKGEILKAYRRMDALVGEARRLVGDDVLFLVCSDHGFSSFRRGVNFNNWLVENGFMTLKQAPREKATLEKLFDTRELFGDVDWSRTKAYAMGLGGIYINLAGRERFGVVLPGAEYDEVRRQIEQGLEALVDPATGERPIRRVFRREEMYGSYDPELVPDLRAATDLNYRVSWQTSLGGFGTGTIEDNRKPWSGDHCSNDPAVVPGILFSNRPLSTRTPRMVDLMPTILAGLGIEPPAGLDGRPLL